MLTLHNDTECNGGSCFKWPFTFSSIAKFFLLLLFLFFIIIFFIRNETGTFYALDLGAATFRVLKIQLGGKQSRILWRQVEQHTIPPALVSSTSEVNSTFHFNFFNVFSLVVKPNTSIMCAGSIRFSCNDIEKLC